jgi:hypothetical protein
VGKRQLEEKIKNKELPAIFNKYPEPVIITGFYFSSINVGLRSLFRFITGSPVVFLYVALSFVFLIRLIPAKKKIAPKIPNKIIDFTFLIPVPSFRKCMPA